MSNIQKSRAGLAPTDDLPTQIAAFHAAGGETQQVPFGLQTKQHRTLSTTIGKARKVGQQERRHNLNLNRKGRVQS